MVRAGLGSELGDHCADRTVDVVMELVGHRLGAAHDVPLDVPAATERGQQRFVDRGDRFLDIALEDAVELEVLARGDAKRAVGPLAADLVMRHVGIGRDHAAGDAGPDHELVVLVEAARTGLLATVAVVLLVDAVEFEQRLRGVAEGRRVLDQLLLDEPAQVIAACLDGLVLREALERCAVGKIGQMDAPPLMW